MALDVVSGTDIGTDRVAAHAGLRLKPVNHLCIGVFGWWGIPGLAVCDPRAIDGRRDAGARCGRILWFAICGHCRSPDLFVDGQPWPPTRTHEAT